MFFEVCNHPELFERADIVAPYSFSEFGRSGPLNRQGDFIIVPYSTRNPIKYSIPELLYLDGGLSNVPYDGPGVAVQPDQGTLHKLNIWTTNWIQHSIVNDCEFLRHLYRLGEMPTTFPQWIPPSLSSLSSTFLPAIPTNCMSHLFSEGVYLRSRRNEYRTWIVTSSCEHYSPPLYPYLTMNGTRISDDERCSSSPWLILPKHRRLLSPSLYCLPSPRDISSSSWLSSSLSRPELRWFVPPVVAPPVTIYCSNRTFVEHQTALLDSPFESLALYGLTPALNEHAESSSLYTQLVPGVLSTGLIANSSRDQIPGPKMRVPEAKSLVYDSAKLARLDSLLQELKAGDHRVLIYFQMTRMMDLMEEYLIYRQYKYLRLDGSSKLEDRRDMVMDWQTR